MTFDALNTIVGTDATEADAVDLSAETSASAAVPVPVPDDWHIMLAGAGAIGCELLKNLAGVAHTLDRHRHGVSITVHLIDSDVIERSNLCRQLLFRERDVGRLKAVVAAERAMDLAAAVAAANSVRGGDGDRSSSSSNCDQRQSGRRRINSFTVIPYPKVLSELCHQSCAV